MYNGHFGAIRSAPAGLGPRLATILQWAKNGDKSTLGEWKLGYVSLETTGRIVPLRRKDHPRLQVTYFVQEWDSDHDERLCCRCSQ